MDTLASTAAQIRGRLRPGELEQLGAIAYGAVGRPTPAQRATAVGVVSLLAADEARQAPAGGPSTAPAGASVPSFTYAASPTPEELAGLAHLAAAAEEQRWAASDLAVFGLDTGGGAGSASLTAEEHQWAASDLAVFGLDTRAEALR